MINKIIDEYMFVPKIDLQEEGFQITMKPIGSYVLDYWQDYSSKWGAFEVTMSRDSDKIVTNVEFPQKTFSKSYIDLVQGYVKLFDQLTVDKFLDK